MKILAYLRASTEEQNASRAKEAIDSFLINHNLKADRYYIENVSGAKLDRPQLIQLLSESDKGDILIIEQVDRLTRLTAEDWRQLKRTIEDKGIHLVSLDLPTSHLALTNSVSLVGDILQHVNNLLLEILATTARKDYEDRRRRQAEGIKIAKERGAYKGRPQSEKNVKACKSAISLLDKGLTKEQAAKVAGIGVATLYRYIKEQNK